MAGSLTRTYKGWAIKLGISVFDRRMLKARRSKFTGHGFAGILLFSIDGEDAHAIRTAVFRTRRQARQALKSRRLTETWLRARVVRVQVTIEEVG